jgi:hypothetical protein
MKCPRCKALVPSSAGDCSECGYAFPKPRLSPKLSATDLLLLVAALVCLVSLGPSTLTLLKAVTNPSQSTTGWLLGIADALARTIVIAAMIVVFLRSQRDT